MRFEVRFVRFRSAETPEDDEKWNEHENLSHLYKLGVKFVTLDNHPDQSAVEVRMLLKDSVYKCILRYRNRGTIKPSTTTSLAGALLRVRRNGKARAAPAQLQKLSSRSYNSYNGFTTLVTNRRREAEKSHLQSRENPFFIWKEYWTPQIAFFMLFIADGIILDSGN
ncbi:hypothetical protein KIN20_037393 [Parelaphostrongylus tenuis]|uniref:Uncharacterized protein n=1 Tax=Parelaphostrongylus tenuis TaxID=148309 RepID=A0AAD5WL49_PARTN|nr:hypothetical protein KIN20_037393 [Parelaphostrongylus tenuis]